MNSQYHPAAFGLEQTHGMLLEPHVKPVVSSHDRGWSSLFVSVQEEAPFEGSFAPRDDYLLILHRTGGAFGDLAQAGRRIATPSGSMFLLPPGQPLHVRLLDPLDSVHLYVRRDTVDAFVRDVLPEASEPLRALRPTMIEDRILRRMIESLAVLVEEREHVENLFIDYFAKTVAAQLVLRHVDTQTLQVSHPEAARHVSPGLGAALRFMQEHLSGKIETADIAQAAGLSASMLAGLFTRELGQPPYRYLTGMRVERARELLEKTNLSLAEVAFACGFTHQEHLIRWFKRFNTMTPAAYRRFARTGRGDD
jgi:AraC family transcriptional regulator